MPEMKITTGHRLCPKDWERGPLAQFIFLLHINGLSNCLQHSQLRMYADETSFTFAGSDVDEMNNCNNSCVACSQQTYLWQRQNSC